MDETAIDRLTRKINVLERFQELYRKGRSLKISRQVLEESGVITGAFIDVAATKLAELDNDPDRLLQALANGEVPHFHKRNIDRLREYLVETEFISEETPMTADEIWLQLAAFMSQQQIDQAEARGFVLRILGLGS